ncbi:hypothetical protein ACEZ3G_16960 [Maribacter algicola]|uniref:Uncharacterized protein n=1 Tax=Meishania litoralis TaxID=3434685 RepID=A0ACC7LN07_9FLAO
MENSITPKDLKKTVKDVGILPLDFEGMHQISKEYYQKYVEPLVESTFTRLMNER